MKLPSMKWMVVAGFVHLSLFSCNRNEQYPRGIEHVVVIGVDGLSPDGIKKADTPILDSMVANGAVKWNVRTVLTSASSQNWASMIMGAGPEQHGVIDNDWEIDDHSLPPVVEEPDGRFPTIFSVIRKNRPDAEIGTVYHWEGFGRLFQKNAVNYDRHFSTEDATVSDFKHYLETKKPTFAFLHMDHVDHAGHEFGHGTEQYYKAVSKTDSLVGEVLNSIRKAGIEENTLVIVTADHGGIGHGHGGATPQEAEIAMILYGKDVKKGYVIQQQVYTYDLASTIAFAFNIAPPYAWIGRAIKPAFDGFDEPGNLYLGQANVSQPTIYPDRNLYAQAGGLYIDTKPEVKISDADGKTIRYTTNGLDPDIKSVEYKAPFGLDSTTVVKARSFDKNGNSSKVSTAYFRLISSGAKKGLNASFFKAADLKQLPEFMKLNPEANWVSPEFKLDEQKIKNTLNGSDQSFAVRFSGNIQIDRAGKYTFYSKSDDGSRLYIDGKEVVNNDGNHGVTEKSGSVELSPGRHAIRVDYYNNGGGFWLDVFYKGPGVVKQLVPANKLWK